MVWGNSPNQQQQNDGWSPQSADRGSHSNRRGDHSQREQGNPQDDNSMADAGCRRRPMWQSHPEICWILFDDLKILLSQFGCTLYLNTDNV